MDNLSLIIRPLFQVVLNKTELLDAAISQAELFSLHLSLKAEEPLAFFIKDFLYNPDLEYMERKMLYISCSKPLNSELNKAL